MLQWDWQGCSQVLVWLLRAGVESSNFGGDYCTRDCKIASITNSHFSDFWSCQSPEHSFMLVDLSGGWLTKQMRKCKFCFVLFFFIIFDSCIAKGEERLMGYGLNAVTLDWSLWFVGVNGVHAILECGYVESREIWEQVVLFQFS